MKLGEYRVVYNAYYNYRAVHDHEKYADVWTVEERCLITFFGLCKLWEHWSEHNFPSYDCSEVIRFKTPEEAFEYVERLLNGNPRGKTIKRVVTEANHERIN